MTPGSIAERATVSARVRAAHEPIGLRKHQVATTEVGARLQAADRREPRAGGLRRARPQPFLEQHLVAADPEPGAV